MLDYQKLAGCHETLRRNKVWCRTCGRSQFNSAAHSLRYGWPKCCGYTMTIDSPEEQNRLSTQQDGG